MPLIDVNGVRLEVRRLQPSAGAPAQAGECVRQWVGQRAPLVFLHEGLGSVAMWQTRSGYWPQLVCDATGRDGVVYSRQGYGQSDLVPDVRGEPREIDGRRQGRLLPDYLHREAWQVLPALLQAVGIESPALIGHSDGGSIALLHAARHPVAACVVMAPHVMVEDVSIRSIEAARTAFQTTDLRERLARYHADVDGAFWQWNDAWLNPAFRAFDIRAECRAIRAPVLAIQGVDDAYGSMAQIDEIEQQIAAGSASAGHCLLLKLERCGHSPQRDQEASTVAHIARFLAEWP